MAKIVTSLILIVMIEIALYMFGGAEYANTSLFALLQDPSNLSQLPFYNLIFASIAGLGTAAIITGLIFQKTDIGFYVLVASAFVTFGAAIVKLWIFVNASLAEYIGTTSQVATGFICAPILIQFLWSMVALIGNRQD